MGRKSGLQALMGLDLFALLAVTFLIVSALEFGVLSLMFTINSKKEDQLKLYEAKLGELGIELDSLKTNGKPKRKDLPPLITLTEGEGFTFASGSATPSNEFIYKLDPVVNQILKIYNEYDGIDMIEIIGHTDEDPLGGSSNLDKNLIDAIVGNVNVSQLKAADNVGLGMMRALSVRNQLMKYDLVADRFNIRIFSAGQTVLTNGQLSDGYHTSGANESRRRIEIRLKRSSGG